MTLVSGQRLGSYEILAAIGSGGMGEVYRARDTKLQRDVALKVLPDHFAADPERLARFQREAQVLASLNHPNIAAIYGLEEAEGVRALVLELVEGPTLADRIAEGRMPIEEALPIARQIAEALDAAHEHGIIHRDLKPANIKVRPDGTVKVLDFGLAKLTDPAGHAGSAGLKTRATEDAVEGSFRSGDADLSQAATLTTPAVTRMGMILGTAAYMSPEQAKGRPIDKRTDIWAFGCVLYEMLTGERAFDGDDASDTLAAVLRGEPNWQALPANTPASVRRLLRRSLNRHTERRLPDIGVARLEIDEALTPSPGDAGTPADAQRARWQPRALLAVAAVLLGSALTAVATWTLTREAPPRVSHLMISLPERVRLAPSGLYRDVVLSPVGTHVVYVGADQLVVRPLDQLEPTVLQGVADPRYPFFSPDGQWIGVFEGLTTLRKVSIAGGPPITVTRTAGAPRGATWAPDDTVVFATAAATGLLRVPASGGEPEVLTMPDREQGEQDHWWPEFLPGGDAILFTVVPTGPTDGAQIAVLNLKTGERKIVVRGGTQPKYVSTGHLVYGAGGTLRAAAFDLGQLDIVGAPVPVVGDVLMAATGAVNFSVSDEGTLVYVPGGMGAVARTLVWVNREGLEEPLKAPPRGYATPRVSPDAMRIAVEARDRENDIWTWDLSRETLTRFTLDPAVDYAPVWTPDGQRLVFTSGRSGVANLFWQAADGTGSVERLTESQNPQFPYSFSADGTQLVFREDAPGTGQDLVLLRLESRRTQPLLQTTFNELNADISPDGRWLAYESDESGQREIYVRPFPDVDRGRWQISTGGGTRPRWARSGRELFYVEPSGALMRVPIDGGARFAAGTPTQLFDARPFVDGASLGRTYDVSPDGQRFLMIKEGGASGETSTSNSIIVVEHWFEELKAKVPRP